MSFPRPERQDSVLGRSLGTRSCSYAEIAGLDEDLRVDFQQVIRVLDNAYLKWSADTAKPSVVR